MTPGWSGLAWGLAGGLFLTGCRAAGPAGPIGPIVAAPSLDDVSESTRLGYIRRAQVWQPIDTASLDLRAGPGGAGALPFDAPITCDYVDGESLSGNTPKFLCRDGGTVYKVKFGDKNGEVFAEAAASRLFWALGFGTDAIYPVQVTCRGCPIDPWWWKTKARIEERAYRFATIERKFDGEPIESKLSGWSWPELDLVDVTAGGAPRAHRDALRLLAVFVQHGDNKRQQQRLVCLAGATTTTPRGERCEKPFLIVSDLGGTFGGAGELAGEGAKLHFGRWTARPVFKDREGCVGFLDDNVRGQLQHPVIHEEGRRFLAERLALLSDAQIRDLFVAARADARGETINDAGSRRPVTVDDWVDTFKRKRQEIVERRCPD